MVLKVEMYTCENTWETRVTPRGCNPYILGEHTRAISVQRHVNKWGGGTWDGRVYTRV